jgi:hypothetical protein
MISGGRPVPVTDTVTVFSVTSPSSSETATVAVYSPAVVYVRDTLDPKKVPPSENVHLYPAIAPPSGSTPDAENVTASGAAPEDGSANASTTGPSPPPASTPHTGSGAVPAVTSSPPRISERMLFALAASNESSTWPIAV